jgi:iron-sulfur cluster repair protein YtfE (RIC family)
MSTSRKANSAASAETEKRYLVTHREHHERMMPHVDALPQLAELLDRSNATEFAARLEEECQFIVDEITPHMMAIEEMLYPQLDRIMDRRHSMQPMREEHERLRQLIASLCQSRVEITDGRFDRLDVIALRRILYRLYTLLKVHLAEEELYLRVIDRDLSDEEKDLLARGVDHASAEPV